MSNLETFENELAQLINKYSMENGSNTPDFIIAQYLVRCLINYNMINSQRENWYGKGLRIGGIVNLEEPRTAAGSLD